MNEQIIINNPGSSSETLTLHSKNRTTQMEVIGYGGRDGDVEIIMEQWWSDKYITMYLNQDQIKALIAYLQNQIK